MKSKLLLGAFLLCACWIGPATPCHAASLGLTVSPEGALLRNGTPYQGVGVNYFNCFLRTLEDPQDTSYDLGFRVLATNGIPFARFAATGFWPVEMRLYQTNRNEYFRRMDEVVRSAERHRVGLIPSLFWHFPTLPDLTGEPMDEWGNPQSRTHALMRDYVREVVGRYKDSPAIWAWELGNEFNLGCDLPNASEHRPPVVPNLGTPGTRSERDELKYEHLRVALKEFGRAVRAIDPHRAITDGNSILREHAWHNLHESSWKADSEPQFAEMLRLVSPDPVDLISIHAYGNAWDRLALNARTARQLKKPLFVGEFQVDKVDGAEARADFQRALDRLREHQVPLAAMWVFDYPPQEKDFNVSATNSRAWQLAMIGRHNAQLHAAAFPRDPQYLVVNLSQGVSAAAFEQVRKQFPSDPAHPVQPGIAAIFSYFGHPVDVVEGNLRQFLRLSRQHQLPVVVQLDGENWWNARPDLWNWWDPEKPGYSPSNRFNVEWSGWSPDQALKIAWRNWGRQLRVLPPPNLMSPAFRAAWQKEMRRLVPIVLEWYRDLPAAEKHLFIGLKVGWESSIGVNAWYYPNGNDLLNQPESADPTHGLRATEVPARGVQPIGYAAVSTAGLRSTGEITEADLADVVRRHFESLCAEAAQLGVPRTKLFTHSAGWKPGELLYDTAVNRFSSPGWSFYQHAANPTEDEGVQRALARSDVPHWAAVEWLYQGPAETQSWERALKNTLSAPGLRYLCIYNWEGIRDNAAALESIGRLLAAKESP